MIQLPQWAAACHCGWLVTWRQRALARLDAKHHRQGPLRPGDPDPRQHALHGKATVYRLSWKLDSTEAWLRRHGMAITQHLGQSRREHRKRTALSVPEAQTLENRRMRQIIEGLGHMPLPGAEEARAVARVVRDLVRVPSGPGRGRHK